MKYARIHEGSVAEIYAPIEGFTIEQCFHASLVAQMTPCSDDVQAGWSYVDGVFTDPAVESFTTPAEPVAEPTQTDVSPISDTPDATPV